MCTPSQPSAGGRSGSSGPLREGETASRDGSRLDCGWRCRKAHRPAGWPTGPPPPRSGARHPSGRIAGWEYPAAAGGRWGCPAPSSPVPIEARRNGGSLVHPRQRTADRHRRPADRNLTAYASATCMTEAVSGRTAISCPATSKVNRTRRTCHQHPRPTLTTDLSTTLPNRRAVKPPGHRFRGRGEPFAGYGRR